LPATEEAKLYVKKLHNNKGNSKEGKGDTQAKPKDEPWLSLSFK